VKYTDSIKKLCSYVSNQYSQTDKVQKLDVWGAKTTQWDGAKHNDGLPESERMQIVDMQNESQGGN